MKDVQNRYDSRRINIRKVGVKSITYPIVVLDKENKTQSTLARVNMYVNLPHRFKGTHMSRFVEILNRFRGRFHLKTFHLILEEMKTRLDAEAAHVEIAFPYFFSTGRSDRAPGTERYDCRLHGSLAQSLDLMVEVDVPLPWPAWRDPDTGRTQPGGVWGEATVAVRMKRFLWIEDLIDLIEEGAAPLTERPVGVEAMCRLIGSVLQATGSFHWYKVVVKNKTSGYSTCASSEWPDPAPDHPEHSKEACFSGGVSSNGDLFFPKLRQQSNMSGPQ